MDETRGLSTEQVLERRAAGQVNALPPAMSRSYFQILRENVFTFINDVLFALGLALVLLGRVSDALVSVGVVLANTLVSVVQEVRAKRLLDQIALLTRPKATVIRDGKEQTIDPGEIVLDDVLLVRPGDQIVVDGQVIGDRRMDVDESLLTGESELIPKRAGDPVYSGSFCVTGSGLYQAQKVGAHSLANEITAGARAVRRVYTPLQQHVNLVIRVILLIVVYFELLLIVDAVINRIALVESVKMSVVIAGLVPNGLFLAIAAAYAIGAVRIVQCGALVQQSNAVESLSNVDVLCLDKTGTLTSNQLKLDSLIPLGLTEEELRQVLGVYAASTITGNRTIDAIRSACSGQAQPLRDEIPFSSVYKWSALCFDGKDEGNDEGGEVKTAGEESVSSSVLRSHLDGVYLLGAPEILAASVNGDGWRNPVDALAARGLRVLLLTHLPGLVPLRDAVGQPCLPMNLRTLGLVSFSDELRPHAQEALENFSQVGIALKIISGDNPQTVSALAKQVGFAQDVQSVSGLDLSKMDGAQLAQAAEDATIFGRITPHQKEELVHGLVNRGHYVAIVGDGVNDVLALKRANLGIAMQSGSQATRSVADIVLLNDSFDSLPYAFREGQRIINGMQDVLKLFLTRVLYATLLILSTAIIGGFPYAPKHNTVLTLFTVGIPALALAAWAKPGALPKRGLIRELLHFVVPATVTLTPLALGVYVFYFASTGNPANPLVAQSALTTFTVLCGLLLIPFAQPPSPAWVGGDELSGDWRPAILALLLFLAYALILIFAPLREFFELVPLSFAEYAVLVLLTIVWAFGLRFVWRAGLLERFLDVELR
jgi:cation-transporting ATPase E